MIKGPNFPVSLPAAGLGVIIALPGGSANGALVPNRPAGAQGLLLILGPNDSVTLCYATDAQGAPTSAPAAANCATYAGAGTGTGDIEVPQFFAEGLSAYVTATSGTPRMRWM